MSRLPALDVPTQVDEARQTADSDGVDIEDLDSRALTVAFALAHDVSEKALLVESLATVKQEAVLGATHRRPLGPGRGVRHDPVRVGVRSIAKGKHRSSSLMCRRRNRDCR